MKLTYLGTGAAEGVPGIYCRCGICENARKKGGKEIRTRSQSLVGSRLLIDFPADTYAHTLAHGLDLPGITDLLVTHSHADHFYPAELEMRIKWFASPEPPLLRVYGNGKVEARMKAETPSYEQVMENLEFHRVIPFEVFEAAGYLVTPLPALHDRSEECLFYAMEESGKALLYAHDTGIFPESVWEWMEKNRKRFDLVSLDCTCMKNKEGTNHMGLADCVEVRRRMLDMGAAGPESVFVLNHFSHNGGWTHGEMAEQGGKESFLTSYDGMSVQV